MVLSLQPPPASIPIKIIYITVQITSKLFDENTSHSLIKRQSAPVPLIELVWIKPLELFSYKAIRRECGWAATVVWFRVMF